MSMLLITSFTTLKSEGEERTIRALLDLSATILTSPVSPMDLLEVPLKSLLRIFAISSANA